MDVSGAGSLSMASLYALFGLAMPTGAATAADGTASMPALAMEAAAIASNQGLVATLLAGTGAPSGAAASMASLAGSLASLSVLDPAVELARLTG
jgi:hypothetical protein